MPNPRVVVKAGRAGNGVKAAASHTGALAGSDVVFDAAIRGEHDLPVARLLGAAHQPVTCFT